MKRAGANDANDAMAKKASIAGGGDDDGGAAGASTHHEDGDGDGDGDDERAMPMTHGGDEEYDFDGDFDEEEMYARTGNGAPDVVVTTCDRASWTRTPLKAPLDASRDAVLFQQMDIDYYIDTPHEWLRERRSKGDAAVLRLSLIHI